MIDRDMAHQLGVYLRFRHVFRNIYGFELEWERCRERLADLPAVYETIGQQLKAFDEFLYTLEESL